MGSQTAKLLHVLCLCAHVCVRVCVCVSALHGNYPNGFAATAVFVVVFRWLKVALVVSMVSTEFECCCRLC